MNLGAIGKLNPFESAQSTALTIGSLLLIGWLIGSNHGSQRAEAQMDRAMVTATIETEKAQSSVDKKVTNLEAHAKVRRAQSEKKASDAVAQIQAQSPAADPVLVWAAAIDSLRDENRAGDAEPAHRRSVGGNPDSLPPSGPPPAYSWAV